MSRQEAAEQYIKALKQGQRAHRDSVLRGRYPYLQVLDEILDDAMVAGRVELGLLEIPTDRIVGTKTAGRRNAFADNFMPLLPEDSEFAYKWISLCADHLGDEGIRDPIRCYEYLGRFYVQEGNKRISVLKSFDAPTVPAHVIRLIPVWTQDPAVQQYYEFLHFYQLSRLYRVSFTQSGGYTKLQAALGFEHEHIWTEEERRSFLSGYSYFREAFLKLGGDEMPVTTADALLVWLRISPFASLKTMSLAELVKSLSSVWTDVKALGQGAPITVSTAPREVTEEKDKGILSRLVSAVFPTHLNVAFIHELEPSDSAWVRAHEEGRSALEDALGGQLTIQVYSGVGSGDGAVTAMEQAIDNGAQVLFTTTAPLIGACRKIAARHAGVRVLNCSTNMPYTGVRTYYSRIYEGKFISGAIAGAMSCSDQLGYIASYPIFGVPAGINAFALGAQLTNPRARVKLQWSCLPGDPVEALTSQGIDFISTLDVPTPGCFGGQWGAGQIQSDGSLQLLASPYWNWGAFYIRLVRGILSGGWDALNADREQAVNYWWGMASGVIGLQLSSSLPEGVQNLVRILQRGVIDGSISPFHRQIRAQDGAVMNDGGQWFSPEEIMHMDWLCDVVDGEIPSFDQLLAKSQAIVRLQGVYRDRIPPEKEGLLL